MGKKGAEKDMLTVRGSYRRVDQLARKKGVTLYQVAKDLGFHNALFSEWKRGKSMPKVDKLLAIAMYFDVSIEAIIKR